jgi:hypothetical protein
VDVTRAVITQILPRVQVADSGCWLWTGAKLPKGYGRVVSGGRHFVAHRLTYAWMFGAIPEGCQIDHVCRNPSCVRPSHLEAVSPQENRARQTAAQGDVCRKGHPYVGRNLIQRKKQRACRECINDSARARRANKNR